MNCDNYICSQITLLWWWNNTYSLLLFMNKPHMLNQGYSLNMRYLIRPIAMQKLCEFNLFAFIKPKSFMQPISQSPTSVYSTYSYQQSFYASYTLLAIKRCFIPRLTHVDAQTKCTKSLSSHWHAPTLWIPHPSHHNPYVVTKRYLRVQSSMHM